MSENIDSGKLVSDLKNRLQSLHDLYSGDLISKSTLSSQLFELIATREAKTFCDLFLKQDITARRMLMMLEDPKRWKDETSSPEEERLTIFKDRLTDIFLESDDSFDDTLEMMLDTACLPHFETLVYSRKGKISGKLSGAKLSVLD